MGPELLKIMGFVMGIRIWEGLWDQVGQNRGPGGGLGSGRSEATCGSSPEVEVAVLYCFVGPLAWIGPPRPSPPPGRGGRRREDGRRRLRRAASAGARARRFRRLPSSSRPWPRPAAALCIGCERRGAAPPRPIRQLLLWDSPGTHRHSRPRVARGLLPPGGGKEGGEKGS